MTRRASGDPPRYEPGIAALAAMIAEPARARMLAYLLGGHAASASELARAASVSASTASAHLAKLVDAALLVVEPRGRHRYFRLADVEVAHALEGLAMVAERSAHDRLWAAPARAALRDARCCYDHLAGRLGVQLMQGLQAQGVLEAAGDGRNWRISARGVAWLRALGLEDPLLDAPPPIAGPRVAYGCMDWSERRDHLAGTLGQRLLQHFVERGWLRREPASRAISVTPRGRTQLLPLLQAAPA